MPKKFNRICFQKQITINFILIYDNFANSGTSLTILLVNKITLVLQLYNNNLHLIIPVNNNIHLVKCINILFQLATESPKLMIFIPSCYWCSLKILFANDNCVLKNCPRIFPDCRSFFQQLLLLGR